MKKTSSIRDHRALINLKRQLRDVEEIVLKKPLKFKRGSKFTGGAWHWKCCEDCKIKSVLGGRSPKVMFDKAAVAPARHVRGYTYPTDWLFLSELDAKQREDISFAMAFALAEIENKRGAEISDLSRFINGASPFEVHHLWSAMREITRSKKLKK